MNIEKYIEDGCYIRKITKRHTLYELAKYKGYSEELCLFLHAKTLECLSYILQDMYPYLEILTEAIMDECEETIIIKLALDYMDYCLRDDCFISDEIKCLDDVRVVERKQILDHEYVRKAYEALLKPNGDFDYLKAYREIIEKHPDFPDIMKKSGHPLPF